MVLYALASLDRFYHIDRVVPGSYVDVNAFEQFWRHKIPHVPTNLGQCFERRLVTNYPTSIVHFGTLDEEDILVQVEKRRLFLRVLHEYVEDLL